MADQLIDVLSPAAPEAGLPVGTVFQINSGNYFVKTEMAEVIVCKLRGNLKKELVYSTSGSRPRRVDSAKRRRSTDPIAVGDRVRIDSALGIIEEILPRHSELSRDSPSQHGQHVLVANLDQVLIVVAARDPQPDLRLLDRFLIVAEAAEIEASVVVNKMDKLEGDDAETRAALAIYEKIGYPVFFVSARQGWGIADLRARLEKKISAFAGASGVGKSSLLNAIQPGLALKTGDIGKSTRMGRHTTTSAELVPLGDNHDGWLADTPGLRQVEFWQVDKMDIPFCFPEFAPYLGQCRFPNCRHIGELGCAILAAHDENRIDARRYQSYLQMIA
jgi:ribosome biogenesis GTPase